MKNSMRIDSNLDLAAMSNSRDAVICGQAELPYSEIVSFHRSCSAIPIVCSNALSTGVQLSISGLLLTEISNKMCTGCIRSPFSIRDISILVDVETELLEALYRMTMFRTATRLSRQTRQHILY